MFGLLAIILDLMFFAVNRNAVANLRGSTAAFNIGAAKWAIGWSPALTPADELPPILRRSAICPNPVLGVYCVSYAICFRNRTTVRSGQRPHLRLS